MSNDTDSYGQMYKDFDAQSQHTQMLREMRAPYLQELDEYSDKGNKNWEDFPEDHPIDGWKMHLNVTPGNVKKVSEFLRTRGFNHKFLSGGEVESGKIFTVYTGSKQMTEKAVKAITDGVGSLLTDPKASGEAKFAPKIVGRFAGDGDLFHRKASMDGIVVARERPTLNKDNIEYARNKLSTIYGAYFGGGIEYYDPENTHVSFESYFSKRSE